MVTISMMSSYVYRETNVVIPLYSPKISFCYNGQMANQPQWKVIDRNRLTYFLRDYNKTDLEALKEQV